GPGCGRRGGRGWGAGHRAGSPGGRNGPGASPKCATGAWGGHYRSRSRAVGGMGRPVDNFASGTEFPPMGSVLAGQGESVTDGQQDLVDALVGHQEAVE